MYPDPKSIQDQLHVHLRDQPSRLDDPRSAIQIHAADAGYVVCLFARAGGHICILLGFPEQYKVTNDCADTDFLIRFDV